MISIPNKKLLAVLIGAFACIAASTFGQVFGNNLILNGDAESGAGSSDGYGIVPIPDWTVTSSFNAVQYAAGGGFPTASVPGPSSRGANFFAGGPNSASASATQLLSLSSYTSLIDGGSLSFELSGYFGGYLGQGDNAKLTASFRDGSSSLISDISIGEVSPADRGNATGLLFRSAVGTVPIGTREVLFTVLSARLEGSYNDGYLDNLSFTVIPELGITPTLTLLSLMGIVGYRLCARHP